jgi:Ca2+-binding RTX toxin-like protein
LIGGKQSDILNGMGGSDTLIGGAGDDIYYYSGIEKIIETSNQGIDVVKASSSYILNNNIEVAMATPNSTFVNFISSKRDVISIYHQHRGRGGQNAR